MRWARHVAQWGRGEVHTGFRCGNLEKTGVDGRKILKGFFRKWNGDIYLIDLAQDRDRWEALVSAVMNLCVP